MVLENLNAYTGILTNPLATNTRNRQINNQLSFTSRAQVIPTNIKSVVNHRKKISNELGAIRSYFLRFFENNSLKVLKKLGIGRLGVHPHFIERVFTRIQEGRIEGQRAILEALQKGTVYKQKGFNGRIIRGDNDLVMVLGKANKKWELISAYDSKTPFTTWSPEFKYS